MVETRPVGASDEGFLLELYASTRDDLAGWPDPERETLIELQLRAQQRDWEARFPASRHELILVDGEAAGRLWVASPQDEWRIVDLTLLPEHRSCGLGTRLVTRMLERADLAGLPVRISVLRSNTRAFAFWERLGFALVGEDEIYLALERPPAEPAAAFGSTAQTVAQP